MPFVTPFFAKLRMTEYRLLQFLGLCHLSEFWKNAVWAHVPENRNSSWLQRQFCLQPREVSGQFEVVIAVNALLVLMLFSVILLGLPVLHHFIHKNVRKSKKNFTHWASSPAFRDQQTKQNKTKNIYWTEIYIKTLRQLSEWEKVS